MRTRETPLVVSCGSILLLYDTERLLGRFMNNYNMYVPLSAETYYNVIDVLTGNE